MTNPPRVVSSWVSWLITIVLSLTSALAHATTCDVDADGDIDRKDYLAILADVGERASGPSDPRDADRNGRILSNDAQLCARRCTLPLCAIPTNKAPTAKNDAATTALNTPVRINVIANDRDRDGRIVPSTVSIVTKPKHGKVTNHRNGKVTYSPARGFRGRDSFRYTVKDNRGAKSNVATVTVTVRPGNVPPANVPPVANNDSAATSVNTPVTINVVANDTDANGNLNPTTVAIVSNPANGAVVNNANGTVTYTPDSGFVGTDSFTYNVKDTPQGATSNTATVTVSVNAAPTANAGPDQNAVTGQPVTLDGSGSSDPSGDMITFSWRFLLPLPSGSGLSDTDIVNRTTPAPSFTPDVDGAYELELTVTDPGGLSDTDSVLITAATSNVAPNADAGLDQNAEVLTLVTLNGSASSDPDNGPVTPLTFQWSFVSVPLGSGIDETDLQPDANSTQPSFTPDEIGLYRLTLTVSDGDLTDTDDVDITVALPNVAPNADAGLDIVVQLGPPAETATLDGSGSNDPDSGPNPLTFQWTFVSVAAGSSLISASIQNANTDTASFTPDAAGMYTLQLRVFDGSDEDFDEVMVTANAAPVALADVFDVDEDTPLTVAAPGVLTNDTDANSDALTAVLDTPPSNAAPGSFTFNSDGSFDYTPSPGFSGQDTFTYHARDGAAANPNAADSNVATVTITVNEVNDAPVAVDDGGAPYTTNEDGGAFAGPSVLTNDTDEEGDPLTAVLNTGPTNASAFNLNADGTFSYTPNADFFGTDTFTYHANDGNPTNSDSNVATVTITVNEVNDAPSFTGGGNRSVLEDAGPQSGSWATAISPGPANESGQTVSFLVSNNNNALFSAQPAVSPSGVLTFTPAPNAFGSATVMVTLNDDGGTLNGGANSFGPVTFTITVTPVNDPPVITTVPGPFSATGNIRRTLAAGPLLTGVSDPDGPTTLTSQLFGTPSDSANVTVNANGGFVYNPGAGFEGNATFQYQVCDDGIPLPSQCSLPAAVTVTASGMIWFIDNSGANGDGRLTNPFNSIGNFNTGAADAVGDNIFLYRQVATNYTGPLVLLNNQRVIGQGASASLAALTGLTPPPGSDPLPATGGIRPVIAHNLNNLTVAQGNLLRGFDLSNSGGTALTGNNFGTLTTSEVSVDNTNGIAINLNNGNPTASFTRVSASGGSNGIVLNNTTGSFTVTGNSSGLCGGSVTNTNPANAATVTAPVPGDCTGGTIQNTTGDGIRLNNAVNVSLTRMQILNSAQSGIFGTQVNGFQLFSSFISNNGNNVDEVGLKFTDVTNPGTVNGLVGSALAGSNPTRIVNSTVRQSGEFNVEIVNRTGTLTDLLVDGSQFTDTKLNAGPADADGFNVEMQGTSTGTIRLTNSFFSNNFTQGAQLSAIDTATLTATVTSSTFTNNNEGFVCNHSGGSDLFCTVGGDLASQGNHFEGEPTEVDSGALIVASTGSSATSSASQTTKFKNNHVTAPANMVNHSIIAFMSGTATPGSVNVSNNTVNHVTFGHAILVDPPDNAASPNFGVTANNNAVTNNAPGGHGVLLQARQNSTACVLIQNNTGSVAAGSSVARVRQNSAAGRNSTLNLKQGVSSSTTAATVMSDNNPGVTTSVAGPTNGALNVVANGACTTPTP